MKLLILLALIPLVLGHHCPNHKYWSSDLQSCVTCRKCDSSQITLRPCQANSDTECSKNDLDLDDASEKIDLEDQEFIKKGKTYHLKLSGADDGDDDIYKDIFEKHSWKKHQKKKLKHHKKHGFNQRRNDKFLGWHEKKHFGFPAYPYHKKHKVNDYKDIWDDSLGSILDSNEKKERKNSRISKLDNEEALQKWLIESKDQFKHRKADLLKTLENERNSKLKLNYPLSNSANNAKLSQSLKSRSLKDKSKHQFSQLDEQILKELAKQEGDSDLAALLSNKKEFSNYRTPVVASHRLFLGEPSTVSEIIGQKDEEEKVKDKVEDVVAVPFTAAERFVVDWQLVALLSAVIACFLFFMVIAFYCLMTQSSNPKSSSYSTEMDEMARIALMNPTLENGKELSTFYVESIPSKH